MAWMHRDDVNAVALIVLLVIIIFGMTLVPPDWYPK